MLIPHVSVPLGMLTQLRGHRVNAVEVVASMLPPWIVPKHMMIFARCTLSAFGQYRKYATPTCNGGPLTTPQREA